MSTPRPFEHYQGNFTVKIRNLYRNLPLDLMSFSPFVVRENPAQLPNPAYSGARNSGLRQVSISHELDQTPITPAKPLAPAHGQHSAEVSVSERCPTITTQPADSRDAARSTQESPQFCRPTALERRGDCHDGSACQSGNHDICFQDALWSEFDDALLRLPVADENSIRVLKFLCRPAGPRCMLTM
jgi:hypothetical protein